MIEDAQVHDLTGSDLCSLVGLGEDYVNELLNSEDAEFRRMLNQVGAVPRAIPFLPYTRKAISLIWSIRPPGSRLVR